MKHVAIALLLTIMLAVPAQGSFCKNIAGQEVCILKIDRSAKNYWEYRVQLAIDGTAQPQTIYNCLERLWLQSDGQWKPFTTQSVQAIACSIFRG